MYKFKAEAQPDGYVRLRISADGFDYVFRLSNEETRRLFNEVFGAWIQPIYDARAKVTA